MCHSGEYVFINIDISVSSAKEVSRPWYKKGDSKRNNDKAREAFKNVKTITFRKRVSSKYDDFDRTVSTLAENEYNYSRMTGTPYKLNNYISALYEGLLLYATAVNESLRDQSDVKNGAIITGRMWGRNFEGLSGNITINKQGDRLNDYSLLDYNEEFDEFREKMYYSDELEEWLKVGEVYWVGGKAPKAHPVCGFDRSKCPKTGFPAWAWSLIAFSLITFIFMIFSIVIYRHYKLEAALAAMSWRIRWEELYGNDRKGKSHVTSSSDKANNEKMKSLDDLLGGNGRRRNSQTNGMLRTESWTRNVSIPESTVSEETIQLHDVQQVFTMTALYKGTIVAVKRLAINRPKIELNRALLLELKKMKDLQNDYITRFTGACLDPPHYCIVTEYCPKGSLQDILENDEMKLDKMMIYSLMHDLVKGMDFIHSSDLKSHGNLKSSNCVVDNRFVLKVTDFGLHYLRSLEDRNEDSDANQFARARNKLWTAPELLRMEKPPLEGTQKGDVYSYGIILHEMAFRQGVFYLENEVASPQDILERVTLRQQPPFRPSIEDGGGGGTAGLVDDAMISLMTKCWSECPTDRPDFPAIRKQVRLLNKKFETSNIVDNLLKRMEQYATNLEGLVEERTAAYLEEKRKAENLLYQLLPQSVAAQLIKGEPVTAEAFESVTIYFSDIVGFTSLCSSSTPMQVVDLLNDLYTCFDSIIESFDVYKVETIGDAYMVVSGLPRQNGKRHAVEIARLSLVLLKSVCSFKIRHRPDEQLKLRIGIHSGPVCAGVVGLKMPRYCLFGDTVNTASRMESNGQALRIHVSGVTKDLLDTFSCFQWELRGGVEMKGKGVQTTYWLLGETVTPENSQVPPESR